MKKIDIIIPCYNPDKEVVTTIATLFEQNIKKSWNYGVIVVNDASSSTRYIEQIKKLFPQLTVLDLIKNKGRSGACDYGAKYSSAEIIVFLDADCVFEDKQTLEKHRQSICGGLDVSFGKVDVASDNRRFWDKYFNSLSYNRDKQAVNKNYMELTSANLAIRKKTYLEIGGFDLDYKHYGFEDRDLISRLVSAGVKLGYNPNITAYHSASLNLDSICKKMKIVGQYTSGLFFNKHPQDYKNMSYSKVDVYLNPSLKLPMKFLWMLFNKTVKLGDNLLHFPFIPFRFKCLIVLAYSTLYFSKGTIMRCEELNNGF